MSGAYDPEYVLPLTGGRLLMQPPFVAQSMRIANHTNRVATVIDGRAGQWIAQPGEVRTIDLGRTGSDGYVGYLDGSASGTECKVSFFDRGQVETGNTPILDVTPRLRLLGQSPNTLALKNDPYTINDNDRAIYFVPNLSLCDIPYFSYGGSAVPFTATQNIDLLRYPNPWGSIYRFRVFPELGRTLTISTPAGTLGNEYTVYASQDAETGPLDAGVLPAVEIIVPSGSTIPVSVIQPSRVSQTLIASVARAGVGNHDFGPFATGFRGGYLFIFYTPAAGGITSIALTDPGFNFVMIPNLGPLVAPGQQVIEIGPGIGPAAAGVTARYSAALMASFSIRVVHADGNNQTYGVQFYPTIL